MVKHNTKSSREFREVLNHIDDVIIVVPNKELFNNTTLEKKSITDMAADKTLYNKHKEFFINYEEVMKELVKHIE